MTEELQTAGRFVVGTDGSERANKAVDWAAERAQVRGMPLLVLNVISEVPIPSKSKALRLMSSEGNYVEKYRQKAQERLDKVIAHLRERYPNLELEGKVVQGNPPYVLAQASRDAFLVVVGARGHGAPMSVRLLGGVSDAVATHSHGPVAVITDESLENPGGPVVVGVDDSEEAKGAIRFAFETAHARGVPLVAVNAWDFGAYDAYNADVWEYTVDEIVEGLTDMVEGQLAEGKAKYPDLPVQIKIVRGRAEIALVDQSKDAGLMVVGSRGRGGFAGLLLGSTSKHVLREAHCPVIVTRGENPLDASV
ncbi:universal stress protein [Propionimicrobium sp. PCR01-08-3]|uniref:universal stress protein n=1 Tax=Propionimicrobium sp. PCR01-08-3 TaxID=3052086 RepID=UPI00255C68B0|nr:universal stress protein [Propionimicrobium sp. PCR01-08-3]WIY82182.1 universal stress protein [Propionimicrobium sp. PCR01-08-3]